jgi:hypothetical protein
MDLGETPRPRSEKEPTAHPAKLPKWYPGLSLTSLTGGPHCQVPLPPATSPREITACSNPPIHFSITPCLNRRLTAAIRPPSRPLPLPFCFSARAAAKARKFLAGDPLACGLFRSIPTSARYPDLSLWPHPLPFAPAHPLMPSVGSNSQHIDASVLGRRPPASARPLATSLPPHWK